VLLDDAMVEFITVRHVRDLCGERGGGGGMCEELGQADRSVVREWDENHAETKLKVW